MTAALLAFLDQLEEARAMATPGEWVQHPADGKYVIGDISDGGESYLDVADTYSFCSDNADADAACIVAEHNALPTLVAALRAVAAEVERMACPANEPWAHVTQAEHGERLLRILTAALTPEATS